MSVRPCYFIFVAILKFFLIHLSCAFMLSASVFAVNSTSNQQSFVLITIQGNSLNVRKRPSISSPIVGTLFNGLKIPLVDINGDEGINGSWFRVEFQKDQFGWISRRYSKKIRPIKNIGVIKSR